MVILSYIVRKPTPRILLQIWPPTYIARKLTQFIVCWQKADPTALFGRAYRRSEHQNIANGFKFVEQIKTEGFVHLNFMFVQKWIAHQYFVKVSN